MIFGDCPHDDCGQAVSRALPGEVRLPAYSRETCPECHKIVWVKYSRVDPTVWTEPDFLNEHTVDESTKQVVEKKPAVTCPPNVSSELLDRLVPGLVADNDTRWRAFVTKVNDKVAQKIADEFADGLLHGFRR